MKRSTVGYYKGRREEDPGKMKFRARGFFKSEKKARIAQKRLKDMGRKTRVVKYTSGYGLEEMAKHDFWKKNYLVDADIHGE